MSYAKHNWYMIFGAVITFVMVLLIVVGYFWTPYSPTAICAAERFDGPSFAHLFGTDNLGRDIFSRVLDGAGTTLFISVSTVLIGLITGILIGGLTGYFGGWIDEVVMRMNDSLTAFPSMLLALVIIGILGPGTYNVIIALGIMFIPSFARMVRSEFVRCKNLDYVKSARLMRAGPLRIIFLHILPNTRSTLLSAVAIGFNNAVLAEAGLSYLGIGVMPPQASLGRMLSESQSYLFSAPWYSISTGFTIILLILGFTLLGEGIRQQAGVD
ncbi:MAG: ABC transporter permease [Oscillospiraceae bacterium]|nr:ABC transporter permease [Oscillospiraceae bacterium]